VTITNSSAAVKIPTGIDSSLGLPRIRHRSNNTTHSPSPITVSVNFTVTKSATVRSFASTIHHITCEWINETNKIAFSSNYYYFHLFIAYLSLCYPTGWIKDAYTTYSTLLQWAIMTYPSAIHYCTPFQSARTTLHQRFSYWHHRIELTRVTCPYWRYTWH
jgi:hypothetical protein